MNSDERDSIAAQFGVPIEQIERDHLSSHVFAFLSTTLGELVQFIGGTALARTQLPEGRLREVIDLIAIDDRKSVATTLDAALPRVFSRPHGRLALEPTLSSALRQSTIIRRICPRNDERAVPDQSDGHLASPDDRPSE